MSTTLLLIDPQNDFCDVEGAALPVNGADADMRRVADFLRAGGSAIDDVVITLDTHPSVAIERTTFWQDAGGSPIPAFTQITADDVRIGRYRPRDARLTPAVLDYLRDLEARGRYRLMVWPVHCVLGTWGHNIHAAVNAELSRWEEQHQRGAHKILKGMNPMTEQYSAVKADVPLASDPLTQSNQQLISLVRTAETLIIAGEAASHCVSATVRDLMEYMSAEQQRNTILLADCMSPVAGFERQAKQFFESAREQGIQVCTSLEALDLVL